MISPFHTTLGGVRVGDGTDSSYAREHFQSWRSSRMAGALYCDWVFLVFGEYLIPDSVPGSFLPWLKTILALAIFLGTVGAILAWKEAVRTLSRPNIVFSDEIKTEIYVVNGTDHTTVQISLTNKFSGDNGNVFPATHAYPHGEIYDSEFKVLRNVDNFGWVDSIGSLRAATIHPDNDIHPNSHPYPVKILAKPLNKTTWWTLFRYQNICDRKVLAVEDGLPEESAYLKFIVTFDDGDAFTWFKFSPVGSNPTSIERLPYDLLNSGDVIENANGCYKPCHVANI